MALRPSGKTGIMNTTAGGNLICPNCGRPIQGLRVREDTVIDFALLYCRRCKTELLIHIAPGQRFYSSRP